ncbi:MAG: hypothetical protein MJ189_05790 [Coriobacteriales bacterium]|nr:hypothetical protein [Coriobacteriales bacterium]
MFSFDEIKNLDLDRDTNAKGTVGEYLENTVPVKNWWFKSCICVFVTSAICFLMCIYQKQIDYVLALPYQASVYFASKNANLAFFINLSMILEFLKNYLRIILILLGIAIIIICIVGCYRKRKVAPYIIISKKAILNKFIQDKLISRKTLIRKIRLRCFCIGPETLLFTSKLRIDDTFMTNFNLSAVKAAGYEITKHNNLILFYSAEACTKYKNRKDRIKNYEL